MLLAGACAGLIAAVLVRMRRCGEALGVEAIVIAGTIAIVVIGLVVTLLAALGIAGPGTSAAGIAGIALVHGAWPRGGARVIPPRVDRRAAIVPAALVLSAIALRWPAMDYALAGRDQGSYTLRAEDLAAHGRLDRIDPVLAAAGAEAGMRTGPGDLLGLYPRRGDAWRDGVYEAGYRPGWYLADREDGHVVPQFFHLHPASMAAALWLAPDHGIAGMLALEAALVVLAMYAVGRRLLGHAAWGALAAAIVVVSPLAIWVHRNNLTETLTALVVACSALAALRARDGRSHGLVLAAFVLGAVAWIRGNGWLIAPVVLAGTALVPASTPRRQRPAIVFAIMLAGSIALHGVTVFPYVYDELHRLVSWWSKPSALGLVGLSSLALVGWWSVDELVFGPRGRLATSAVLDRLRRHALAILVVLGVAAVAVGWLRPAGGPSWSRLDALAPAIGPVLGGFALVGAAMLLRVRVAMDAAHAWLVMLVAVVVATAALYLPHTLPTFGLYYYGRYLVPELLPALALAAVVAVRGVTRRFVGVRARIVGAVLGTIVVAGVAAPLVRWPVTRLVEFAGTGRLVEALAARIPADAVVVAGGEGWHHGHTFNQVAGALALRHDRVVVPYVTREAAIASVWELTIGAHADAPAPPVFLLINEATHAVRPAPDGPTLAAFDDLLPPPFAARSIAAFELAADRLTPSTDALPSRVTRDRLRMVLVEVAVDPDRWHELRRWWPRVAADGSIATARSDPALPELAIHGPEGAGPPCLRADRDLVIELPDDPRATSLALVATPGSATYVGSWELWADDVRLALDPPGLPARARDTLGPWTFARAPRRLRIRGASRSVADAICPEGGIAELRAWSIEHGALDDAPLEQHSLSPPDDLGHPIEPVRWVAGRGLSRYRSGVGPAPELRAVSLALRPGAPLEFPAERLPGEGPVDLVVNLTGAALSSAARIVVRVDGTELGELDPPETRNRSWQSPILVLTRTAAVARISLELRDAAEGDVAWVRDVGLFSRP